MTATEGSTNLTNESNALPAGWYYAEGDPAGTQRYWDGAQWIGSPQAALTAPGAYGAGSGPNAGQPVGAHQYGPGARFATGPGVPPGVLVQHAARYRTDKANYGQRVVAWLIDALVWWGPFVFFVILSGSTGSEGLAVLAFVSLFAGVGNSLVLQGLTARSLGKRVMGTKIVRLDNDGEPGLGLVLLRFLIPWAFSFFSCQIYWLLDFLWPLWDEGDERITDKILKLAVVRA